MSYLEDIESKAISMPFGELDVRITRHRSKTTKVAYVKDATIEPKTNEKAFLDLQTLLNSLISNRFSGKLKFDVAIKGGTIQLITIKNKEIKTYGPIES